MHNTTRILIVSLVCLCFYLGVLASSRTIFASPGTAESSENSSAPAVSKGLPLDSPPLRDPDLSGDALTVELAGETVLSISAPTGEGEEPLEQEGTLYGEHADYLLRLANRLRQDQDIPELNYDPALEAAARRRCAELSLQYGASRPGGRPWFTAPEPGADIAGENLGRDFDTASAVMESWQSSSAHTMNLLNRSFTRTAAACLQVGEEIYWVQLFGY